MGPEGYLTEVYRRYTIEDLRKFYLKGESALLVFTEAQEVTKLRHEMKEENDQLKSLYIKVSLENADLKARMKKLEEAFLDFKKKLSS